MAKLKPYQANKKSWMKGRRKMIKKPWMKGVITGALLGGLILGSVGIVYASSDSSSTNGVSGLKAAVQSMMPGGRGHGSGMGMDLDLATLVKDSVITSAESTAIQTKIDALNASRKAEMDKVKAMTKAERDAYFKANQTAKTGKTDLLTTLVNENIISSDKADAIRTAMQAQRQQQQQTRLTEGLSGLVTAGTITQTQSDAILAKFEAQQTTRQAEMDKVKAMTETEREAYFKANTPKKDSLLADLVTAGTITQAQADAVKTVIGGPGGADKGDRGHGGPGEGMGHGGGMGRGPANSSTTQTNPSK
jgi:competence protein ComGC